MNLDKIREAANRLHEQVGYAIEEIGGMRIDNIRALSDQLLRAVDNAKKDTTTWVWDGWKDDEDKPHFAGYCCKKCWHRSVIKYPFCPGCGRKIEGGTKG
jgi:hypothetical protein